MILIKYSYGTGKLLSPDFLLIHTIVLLGSNYKVGNMQTFNQQNDSPAWVFQTWAAFILSISMTTFGVVNLPVDNWIKGFMGMGLAFSVGSTFTLAKM